MRITRTTNSNDYCQGSQDTDGTADFPKKGIFPGKAGKTFYPGDQNIQDIGDHTAQDERRDQAP